jgi:hypothetical protein
MSLEGFKRVGELIIFSLSYGKPIPFFMIRTFLRR